MATEGAKYPCPCTPEILRSFVMDDEGYIEMPSHPYDEVLEDVYISDG